MKKEVPTGALIGAALVLVAVLAFFLMRIFVEPTVQAKDIKAPPPPGGFPKSQNQTPLPTE